MRGICVKSAYLCLQLVFLFFFPLEKIRFSYLEIILLIIIVVFVINPSYCGALIKNIILVLVVFPTFLHFPPSQHLPEPPLLADVKEPQQHPTLCFATEDILSFGNVCTQSSPVYVSNRNCFKHVFFPLLLIFYTKSCLFSERGF